jgi:hypothetical protein
MTCFSSLPLLYLFLDDFPRTVSRAVSSVILNSFHAFTDPFSLIDFLHYPILELFFPHLFQTDFGVALCKEHYRYPFLQLCTML